MKTRDVGIDDPLEDFSTRQFEFEGESKKVYEAGAGPAVIVMPEVPGISPPVARFARWVRDAGFHVYMPSLFGRDGAVVSAEEGGETFQRLCVSAEFNALQSGRSSKVTTWLRALARTAHLECGGPGVGAVGMCFTGNFALTMMLDAAVIAPVLGQPALPLNEPGGLEISAEELIQIRSRLDRENLKVIGLRFRDDPLCTAARFTAYHNALGEHFEGVVVPDEVANKDVSPFMAKYVPSPHSVLTQHLIDKEGELTLKVRDDILQFLKLRLQVPKP
jgi:dienelactone hydrolase